MTPDEIAAVLAEHEEHYERDGRCMSPAVPLPAHRLTCPTYRLAVEAERLAGKVARVEAKVDQWSKSPGAPANAAAAVLRAALADPQEVTGE